MKGYFAGLSRNTFLLALASLFSDISTEMLYPVLPVFLTETLGVTGSVVGVIEGWRLPFRTSCRESRVGSPTDFTGPRRSR